MCPQVMGTGDVMGILLHPRGKTLGLKVKRQVVYDKFASVFNGLYERDEVR